MSLPRRSPSADAAAPAASVPSAFCFSIRAAAEPGAMPRVLALFAKRGMVPSKVHAVLVDAVLVDAGPLEAGVLEAGVLGAGVLEIDIQVAGLAEEAGRYIAECLRQQMAVEAVLTAVRPR